MVNFFGNFIKQIELFFVKYINGWKKSEVKDKVGMISDVFTILTFGLVVSAFIGVLELAYFTEFGKLFAAGIGILIFTMIWLNIWQPIARKLKDNTFWKNVATFIYGCIWLYFAPAIALFIYKNLGNCIDFLKSLL